MGLKIIENSLAVLSNKTPIRDVNHIYIALIPKIENPKTVAHYRPISLCNVSYKVITKTIANRLKSILDMIISNNQSAFVPGRLITDNAIIGFECLQD